MTASSTHGYDGKLDLTTLDIEDRIGQIALRIDQLACQIFVPGPYGHQLVNRSLKVRMRRPAPAKR